ncbi:DNA primase [Alkalicaulis satelles]|uniref:DNA primase n=1 Tax=Alkalicaulis satelles TaxID=2609175 RepID=A0A5M6ZGA0_9PROT|nr:DNA primase [Alkalicaulis satelles]KAA5803776.1 DNA primase [Alkalicaulis satelles]
MAIPDGFIDEIKARIRPSELIGRTVALKRQGREFAGLSPFKKERTPSFFVNDEKGFYHCFASQEHGDIFTWLQKTQGLSFMEAVEALAREAGLDVPRDQPADPEREARRQRALDWMEAAHAWFARQLQSPAGAHARAYLESRGLTPADCERFELGFAPDQRRGLTQALMQKGASVSDLQTAGLIITPDDGGEAYDRFRGRITFAIRDPRGRLTAFGARALSKDQRAKYLNSPETALFHKGSTLYRYREARAAANDPKSGAGGLIVAEGYMDVIAFARAGLAHAVAPLGTALTENQMALLWRAGGEPVVCLDGDGAGQRAAALAADRALPLLAPGKTLRFVFLPDGADPDDLLRDKGPEALQAALAKPRPLIDVLWEREVQAGPLDDPDRRAAFRKRLRALCARIADPDVRAEYRAEFDARLNTLFARTPARRGGSGRRAGEYQPPAAPSRDLVEAARKPRPERAAPLARQLLAGAVEFPEIACSEAETLAELDFGPLDSLRDAVLDACLDPAFSPEEGLGARLAARGMTGALARLSADRAAARAALGGEESDARSRAEAWRRLSASYMEQVAHDVRKAEDRARLEDAFNSGDPDAFKSCLAAVRRGKLR